MSPLQPTQQATQRPRRRATWLGVFAGIVAKFGASTILIGAAIVGGRIWAVWVNAERSWTEHMEDVQSTSWFLLQGINVLSAVLAGWVVAWLSPPRSILAPAILVALFAIAAGFAQLPATRSMVLLSIWALGAPVGVAVGAALHRRSERHA